MARDKHDDQSRVNGFINLYKPTGITSMDALRQIKRITNQRHKVGHGGTMDPLARGVLPVCLGQATRLMDFVVASRKQYLVKIKLGATTNTYDAEGEVVDTRDVGDLPREKIEETLRSFVGLIQQTPPMFSAIKIKGQRLYKLARAGIEVAREARPVEIYEITVVDYTLPVLVLEVASGRGVYMRSLAHDLGEALGCGGHVIDLVRLSSGGFKADEAVTLEELEEAAAAPSGWQQHLHPIDWVLRDLKSISLGRQAEQYLRHGQSISLSGPVLEAGYLESFRAYGSDGQFLALVRLDRAANAWRPVKVFQVDSPSPYAPVSPQAV